MSTNELTAEEKSQLAKLKDEKNLNELKQIALLEFGGNYEKYLYCQSAIKMLIELKAIPELIELLDLKKEKTNYPEQLSEVKGLISIGKKVGKPVIDKLESVLQPYDWRNENLVRACAFILGEIREENAIPSLIKALQLVNENEAYIILDALAKFKYKSSGPLAVLLSNKDNKYLMRYVLIGLGKLKNPSTIDVIKPFLRYPDILVVLYAAEALAWLGYEDGLKKLHDLTRNESHFVRDDARDTLIAISKKRKKKDNRATIT